jgi:hypothetical protein
VADGDLWVDSGATLSHLQIIQQSPTCLSAMCELFVENCVSSLVIPDLQVYVGCWAGNHIREHARDKEHDLGIAVFLHRNDPP